MVQPLSEKQKRHIRRVKGIMKPFSANPGLHPVKRVREFNGDLRADFVPCKIRGRSGVRMSHEKRALVLQRAFDRAAFFAALES